MDENHENRKYTAQPPASAYSDAFYRQAPDRGDYGYTPAQCYAHTGDAPPTEAGTGKKHSTAGVLIMICVVCVLIAVLSGTVGVFWIYHIGTRQTADAEAEREIYTELSDAAMTNGGLPLDLVSADGMAALPAQRIYADACHSVVGITSQGYAYNIFGQLSSFAVTGSGIVLTADGYILTNFSVIEAAYDMGMPIQILTADGEQYDAEIVGVEADGDLAVLKTDAPGLVPAVLGDSDELSVGQRIYAIGNPLGELTFTMTRGIISALDREFVTEANSSVYMFQIDAAVNDGNYGGPVLNSRGQVIGIVTTKIEASIGTEGLNFAIPINDACGVAQELVGSGYVAGRAYLGLKLAEVTDGIARYYDMVPGVFIHSVKPGSCSEQAGLRSGDIITAIDGTPVSSVAELTAAVREYRAGDSAELTVCRDDEYITVTVTFDAELPAERMSDAEASLRASRGMLFGHE